MTTWTYVCATSWKPTSSSSWRTSTIRKPFGGRGSPLGRARRSCGTGRPRSSDADRRFLGYWLGRPYWGRGIGSRALALFLERERNRPLHADPVIGNTGSVRLLEKLGFQRTGTVRHGDNEHVMLVLAQGAPR